MNKILKNSNAWFIACFAVFLCTIELVSCEKEVDINIAAGEETLVVQGQIENDQPPFVVLTKSLSFFDKIDLAALEKSFIHDAEVSVSDGIKTVQLKEYTVDTGANANKFYFYSLDTSSISNLMLGEFEKLYTLTIKYNGEIYEATTKIPSVQGIDKLYSGVPVFERPGKPDNAVGLYVSVKDPDTLGNYIRYYTKRNNEPFYPVDVVSAEEIGANGSYLDSIAIGFGYPREDTATSVIYPFKGDSITVKWSAIDRNVYKFWQTYSYAVNVVGNPFASPINVPSNISIGALGVWAGYGVSYKAFKIPD